MDYQLYKRLAPKALGREKAGLVLKNANVLNVFTEEIITCDVAIDSGMIIGLGKYDGETERDMTGKYLVPGFIDAHLHLETTLVLPSELIAAAVKCGTTTFITDPHEAANVAGEDGIDYMLDQTEDADANVFVMIPSCVPSCAGEDNGCVLSAERMRKYLDNPRVLGLAEVMDYLAVTEGDDEMMKKLSLFNGRIRDGHAPFLSDKRLAAYVLAKIKTDHECSDYDYAMKQRRNGMYVLIREGSGAKNVEAIVTGLVENSAATDGFAFCTDDKHIDDIISDGHISYNIRKSIALGIPPIKAYKMATLNAAQCYGFESIGAIAPGYQADIVVLDDLDAVEINTVFFRGKEVTDYQKPIKPCPEHLRQTVHIAPVTADALRLWATDSGNEVIQLIGGQITTKRLVERLNSKDGLFVADSVYNKAVVVERHRASGRTGVAPVKGFGLSGGAIAISVSHDSHNIIAIGDNDADILRAISELEKIQGGYVIARDGGVVDLLPLPVMGLISDIGYENVVAILHRMICLAHGMGVPQAIDPFLTLSFIALPVIQEIRVTTRGIVTVN